MPTMARDHARIQTAIWRNREFRKLSRGAQHLYFTILSQPALSYCGVMDWWPNRLAALSEDADEQDIFDAIKELHETHFVYIDSNTSELLVRTYARHDGVLQRINMGKALGRAIEKVASMDLLDIIFNELGRLYREQPDLQGWLGINELYPDDMSRIVEIAEGK